MHPLPHPLPQPQAGRRAVAVGLPALLVALLAAGCAGPLPPVQWLRLPAEPAGAAAAVARPAAGPAWQLMAPVPLPGHLDRDALLVPQGQAGLQPLGGARWAEPLRDAVPRLLRQDLGRLLGAPPWTAPLPPGVRPARQLRLEISVLDVGADGRSVRLQARWSLADPSGTTAPQLGEAAFITNASGADADALAVAHRQALWQLAQRIAATP
ncbi:PqiC family protein [Pseudaquabacterium pictum]|uniref:ABC-type transport auxiliary lipoprotein component domain-containing protein n=1 Tax=Pseudaquabacterium pictum TaxID=2315236 RepID=A0A480APF8_9BURK|nr:PqiC family protein [Rubrivivax pictus]GCL63303.1 hypothetical protein AQPW35_23840 [Rubrivivax pictus]